MRTRIIAFHPEIAREVGIEEAIYFQQLWYWGDKGDREDGYIWKSMPEIEQETCLSDKQQRRVRAKLERLGWISTKQEVIHGRTHYLYKTIKEISVTLPKGHPSPAQRAPDTITKNTHILSAERGLNHFPSNGFDIVVETEHPKSPSKRVDEHVLAVFRCFGKYPKVWEVNRTQRGAAERLFERGIEQVQKAVNFYREYKDHNFCPNVSDPWKLDNKWGDLYEFKKKNSL